MYFTNINREEFRRIAKNPYERYSIGNDDEATLGALSHEPSDIVMPRETILGHLQRTIKPNGQIRYVKRTPEKGDGTILGEVI